MTPRWPVEILGTGAGIPQRVLTNHELAAMVDTSDDWIVTRTGIRERRIASDGESTLTLGLAAARQALAEAGLSPTDVDLIIFGTVTPDYRIPACACQIQRQLGARQIPAFDLNAACSGFVYGLIAAAQFVAAGSARRVLVIGGECLSRVMDMQDRTTCILFGDAAAAAVVAPPRDPQQGILSAVWGCDGSGEDLIWIPAGGSREPTSLRTVNERLHYIRMRGREVYKFAVVQIQELIRETLRLAGRTLDEVKLLIPHQSNLRMIESACEKLDIRPERVYVNIERFGNTSAASIPLALHEARARGRIRPGDLVLLVALGAGLTWASVLMRL